MIAACAAMATAFYVYSSSTGAECNSPSRNVLVVLDFTGQASLTTGEIVSRVQSLFDNIRNGERFAIFDTRADAPIFETCFSSLTTAARSGDRDKLTDTVVQAIAGNAAAAPASFATAPRQKISVKITDLSLTKYLRGSENSLHLVSDLLEGSPATFDSLCQPANRAIDNFRLARRGGMEQPAFVHTHIHLHLVPRQDVNPAPLNCRDKYWRWLLANASGTGAGMSIAYLPSSIRSSNE